MKKFPASDRLLVLTILAGILGAAVFSLQAVLEERAEAAEEPHESVVRLYGRGSPRELAEALVRAGSAPEEAVSITRAAVKRLGPGSGSFVVTASTTGAFHHVTAFRGKRRAVIGRAAKGVKLVEVEETLRRAEGTMSTDLKASLFAARVPGELHQEFVDAFRWHVDFSADARPGDRFALWWTERSGSGKVMTRRLEAVSYEGETIERIEAIRWDGEFFDARGRSLRRPFLRAPLRYYAISSAFGGFRFSPLGWPMRRHKGTDYSAPEGTPILCVSDGAVVFAGVKPGYGNVVHVRHTGGRDTVYAHLRRFGPGIRKGRTLRQGQVIGYVGATGRATGPHLHLELRRDGKTEDYREASLPNEPIRSVSRPSRFKERWKQLLG